MPYDKKRVAMRIKSLRADKGWDQNELALKSGISKDSITRYELGTSGMGLDAAFDLTAALGCSLEKLVCRD